jgi:hypothetical protein
MHMCYKINYFQPIGKRWYLSITDNTENIRLKNKFLKVKHYVIQLNCPIKLCREVVENDVNSVI